MNGHYLKNGRVKKVVPSNFGARLTECGRSLDNDVTINAGHPFS